MACPHGEFEKSGKMQLRNCKKKNRDDATFVVKSSCMGHQFRVANTNLCLQKMGHRRGIRLRHCKRKEPLQLFDDFR